MTFWGLGVGLSTVAVRELMYTLPLLQLLSLAGRELREGDGMTLLSQATRGDGKT